MIEFQFQNCKYSIEIRHRVNAFHSFGKHQGEERIATACDSQHPGHPDVGLPFKRIYYAYLNPFDKEYSEHIGERHALLRLIRAEVPTPKGWTRRQTRIAFIEAWEKAKREAKQITATPTKQAAKKLAEAYKNGRAYISDCKNDNPYDIWHYSTGKGLNIKALCGEPANLYTTQDRVTCATCQSLLSVTRLNPDEVRAGNTVVTRKYDGGWKVAATINEEAAPGHKVEWKAEPITITKPVTEGESKELREKINAIVHEEMERSLKELERQAKLIISCGMKPETYHCVVCGFSAVVPEGALETLQRFKINQWHTCTGKRLGMWGS